MNKFHVFVVGLIIGAIGTMIVIFNDLPDDKIDVNIDEYIHISDSLKNVIDNQQFKIDSLNKRKTKIIIKYETLYNYMLIADNDSIVSYISKKIYSRE